VGLGGNVHEGDHGVGDPPGMLVRLPSRLPNEDPNTL